VTADDAVDAALVERVRTGDVAAYDELVQRHMRRAHAVAFRLLGHREDAEDLVQETLIAIHAKRATWDRTQSFTGWAYAIARHKLVDHLRRQGRRPTHPLEEASALFADHTVEDGAARADLGRCLSLLPTRQRRLIEDVRLTGMSVAEAAERHGYSVVAAKVSIHRSLKTLTARFAGPRPETGSACDED